MQPTNLNKIINMLLAGSFALVIIMALWIDDIKSYYGLKSLSGSQAELSGAVVALATTLFLISVVLFLGCVIDALAELVVRLQLEKLSRSKLILRMLFAREQDKSTRACKKRFNDLLHKCDGYKDLASDVEDDNRAYATAIFFKTAKPEAVDWVVQHYSTYFLATNYIMCIIIFAFVLPVLHWFGIASKTLTTPYEMLFILTIAPLLYISMDRKLYSYEVVYSHTSVILIESLTEKTQSSYSQT